MENVGDDAMVDAPSVENYDVSVELPRARNTPLRQPRVNLYAFLEQSQPCMSAISDDLQGGCQ